MDVRRRPDVNRLARRYSRQRGRYGKHRLDKSRFAAIFGVSFLSPTSRDRQSALASWCWLPPFSDRPSGVCILRRTNLATRSIRKSRAPPFSQPNQIPMSTETKEVENPGYALGIPVSHKPAYGPSAEEYYRRKHERGIKEEYFLYQTKFPFPTFTR